MSARLLVAGVLSLAAHAAAAQQVETVGSCWDATTQTELNICARDALQEADDELNRVYQALTADAGAERGQRIRTAQRAWIAFGDAHCEVEPRDYEGGSMELMVYGSCMTDVTRQRTAQLLTYLTTLRNR